MRSTLRFLFLALFAVSLLSACKKENDMYAFGGNIYTISVDLPAIKDVPADNPGQIAIVVTTDAPYWMVQAPNWVKTNKLTCPGRANGTILAVTVESNYRNMATTTDPRSGIIRIIGGRTSVSIPINQLGHEGWVDPATVKGGIYNLNDFMDFVAAVNDGESPVRWMNNRGEVELMTDIDLRGIEDWAPIGSVIKSGNVGNATAPVGVPFTGVFNGGGHKISYFEANATVEAGGTWGFFGYLQNATVKDVNFDGVDVTVGAAGIADAGIVAGTMSASTIENVTVKGRICSAGSTGNERFAIGGIAGFVISETVGSLAHDSYIKNCAVELTAEIDCGSNTGNGAAGVMYGGIAGFCTGVKEMPSRNHIENCVNRGTMTMNVGRSSGIIAAANYGTILSGCTNKAFHVSNFHDGRISQICCLLGLDSAMIDCANEGDLTTSDSATTAGALAALINDDSVYIEGGTRPANTGNIICANTVTRGLAVANFSKFDHVSNLILSGNLYTYKADGQHVKIDVNNGNIRQYMGKVATGADTKITSISYVSPSDLPAGPTSSGNIVDLNEVADHWN